MAVDKQYDFFLCHASEDKAFSDKLYDLLEKAGFHIWYDEKSLIPNADLALELPKIIKKCEGLIVLLSKNSAESSWVQNEHAFARQLHNNNEIKIIPIVIDDYDDLGFYNNYKWIDCSEGITPDTFFMILSAMYGSAENMREEKDIYVSYPWRENEQKLVNTIFSTIRQFPFRMIGDATNQAIYDEDDRITKIMNTCGAFIGILPYREGSNTSRYILDEIRMAEKCKLNGIIIADARVALPENVPEKQIHFPIFRIEDTNNINVNLLSDFISSLEVDRPKKPHVFYATNLDNDRKHVNSLIRNLAGSVTATRCILGEDIDHSNLQTQIIDRIKDAYVMIADITGDGQCNECDKIGTESKDKTYRFNTCIEAGIARGADTVLFIVAKAPRHSPPFMFRDINIRYYADDCELLAIVHKVLRPYRRSVL